LRKKNSKGVSEIVATVLMIMIVAAVGFSIFLYGLGFFTASTSARDLATQTGIATLRERFIIVESYFNLTGNTVSVWVYNYGETNVQISSVYLNATTISPPASVFIEPTKVVRLDYTVPGVVAGQSQLIRVVSSLGNYYENYYRVD
jgi:flagellin-like protein